jgi:lantibiotic modifying enzyme
MCTWCHGASGIGLSRVSASEHFKDEGFDEEIDIALETTKQSLNTASLTLCCGLLGHLEFFNEASNLRKNLEPSIKLTLQNLFSRMDEPNDSFYNPGLMQGKAGIGFTLLRLLDKKGELPQVLLLK